jgi:hypothetical protein
MMKRGTLNFVVVLVSFVNLVFLVITGHILKYILPPDSWESGEK